MDVADRIGYVYGFGYGSASIGLLGLVWRDAAVFGILLGVATQVAIYGYARYTTDTEQGGDQLNE